MRVSQRGRMALGRFGIADVQLLAVDADQLGGEALTCLRRQDRLERPVLAGDEGIDLALPLDDEPHGDGLDAAGGQTGAADLVQERAEGVADETVDDASRLLRIDQVLVDAPRVQNASRIAGSVISLKVTRRALSLGTWAASATCHAMASPSRSRSVVAVDGIGPLGRPLDLGDLLAPVVGHDVLGLEVMVDVDAELALAGVLRKVTDVAVGGQDTVVRAEVALDRSRLCRRSHDHKVLWHAGSLAPPAARTVNWNGGASAGASALAR